MYQIGFKADKFFGLFGPVFRDSFTSGLTPRAGRGPARRGGKVTGGMSKSSPGRPFIGGLLAVLSAVCFSTSAIFAKLGFSIGLAPGQLLQLRFTYALPLLAGFILFKDRRALSFRPRLLLIGLILGAVCYSLQSSLYYHALTRIPASTAALILYFYPVAVALLARPIYNLRLDRPAWAALGLVVVGCSLVFYDAFRRSLDPTGLGLAAGAMVTYSFYLIMVQTAVKKERPLALSFHVSLGAALVFNLLGRPADLWSITGWGLVYASGLALISTCLGLTLLYMAIDRLGSAHVAVFSAFEPISILILSYFLLGEHVVAWQMIGAGLIVGGIVLKNLILSAEFRLGRN